MRVEVLGARLGSGATNMRLPILSLRMPAIRSAVLRGADRVKAGLTLHFGIELGAEQNHDRGNPEPRHESYHRAEGSVSLVELAETGHSAETTSQHSVAA